MQSFKNILVSIDTHLGEHPMIDEAVQIALSNGAKLTLVDVVPEFPWIAQLLATDYETIRQLIGRQKQEHLEALALAIRENGIDVEAKVLWGQATFEIVHETLRGQHDLVLRVANRHNSRETEFFDSTGRQLLRDGILNERLDQDRAYATKLVS